MKKLVSDIGYVVNHINYLMVRFGRNVFCCYYCFDYIMKIDSSKRLLDEKNRIGLIFVSYM